MDLGFKSRPHADDAFRRQVATRGGEGRWLAVSTVAAFSFAAGCAACIATLGPAFNEDCTGTQQAIIWQYTGCYSWAQWFLSIGAILCGFGFFASASYAVESAGRFSRFGNDERMASSLVQAALLATTVAGCVLSWTSLMKPSETYQVYADGTTRGDYGTVKDWTIDNWQVFLGGLIFAAGVPFAIGVASALLNTRKAPRREDRYSAAAAAASSALHMGGDDVGVARDAAGRRSVSSEALLGDRRAGQHGTAGRGGDAHSGGRVALYTLASLLFLGVCFVLASTLSPIWNLSATTYFKLVSPYSLGFWPLGGDLPYCADDPSQQCSCAALDTDPSTVSGGSDHYFVCWFTFKVYPDTVLFYSFLGAAVLLGGATHAHGWLWARRRLRPPLEAKLPAALQPFPNGLSVLEATAVGATVCLYVAWWVYWFVMYDRFHTVDAVTDCPVNANLTAHGVPVDQQWDSCGANVGGTPHWVGNVHVAARAMGHMASLSFALTLLPVAKHSLWLSAMGVGWEQVLHWHRGLGTVGFVTVTLHFALWIVKFVADGTLTRNLGPNIDTNTWFWVSPVQVHYENWSVLMAMVAYVCMAAALLVAWTLRRRFYRLFYVLHHTAVVFLVVGLVHAWSFWFFAIPGFTVWWLDRVARMARSTWPVRVAAFGPAVPTSTHVDITLVELDAPELAARFQPGQFAFINVPTVSRAQWHPFTVNVRGSRVLFLIKAMTNGGWTSKLRALAMDAAQSADPDSARAAITGAFAVGLYGGVPRADYTLSPVLLMAGGVGITPVISVFQAAMRAPPTSMELTKDVTMVWVVQHADMLALPHVSDVIREAAECEEDGVRVIVHITRHKGELPAAPGTNVTYVAGRPDIARIVGDVVARSTAGSSVLPDGVGFCFGCGPDRMQKTLLAEGARHNFARSHVETFLF